MRAWALVIGDWGLGIQDWEKETVVMYELDTGWVNIALNSLRLELA